MDFTSTDLRQRNSMLISALEIDPLFDSLLAAHGVEKDTNLPTWITSISSFFERAIMAQAHLHGPLWELNRDLNPKRAFNFLDDMVNERWWFTPDPLVISPQGRMLNGQHRALAIVVRNYHPLTPFKETEDGKKVVDDAWIRERFEPIQFVLVTGVEERAALLLDEARRTASDRRAIAMRYAR
jgi:hypothetical protein